MVREWLFPNGSRLFFYADVSGRPDWLISAEGTTTFSGQEVYYRDLVREWDD